MGANRKWEQRTHAARDQARASTGEWWSPRSQAAGLSVGERAEAARGSDDGWAAEKSRMGRRVQRVGW
eukprot:scaffold4096_cov88-Isochrysis_galbana.AAC.2